MGPMIERQEGPVADFTVTRLPDWQHARLDFLAARRSTPFRWGVSDCVLLAADQVQAITGWDPVADVRGLWNTGTTARAFLEAHGGLEQMCVDRLGPPRLHRLTGQPGDVALLPPAEGDPFAALGVVEAFIVFCQGPDGISRRSLHEATQVWPIGWCEPGILARPPPLMPLAPPAPPELAP